MFRCPSPLREKQIERRLVGGQLNPREEQEKVKQLKRQVARRSLFRRANRTGGSREPSKLTMRFAAVTQNGRRQDERADGDEQSHQYSWKCQMRSSQQCGYWQGERPSALDRDRGATSDLFGPDRPPFQVASDHFRSSPEFTDFYVISLQLRTAAGVAACHAPLSSSARRPLNRGHLGWFWFRFYS